MAQETRQEQRKADGITARTPQYFKTISIKSVRHGGKRNGPQRQNGNERYVSFDRRPQSVANGKAAYARQQVFITMSKPPAVAGENRVSSGETDVKKIPPML